jgi:hypothetical protein
MKIVATRTTALFAGMWIGVGSAMFQAWREAHSLEATVHAISWGIFLSAFFIAPVILFVIGLDYFRNAFRDFLGPSHMESFKVVSFRSLWWFFGVAIASAIYSVAESLNAI